MPTFSKKYLAVRKTLHPDLQALVDEAIDYIDFSLVCGYRNRVDQEEAFKTGHSKAPWPQSKHNRLPSDAFDFMPYPDGKKEDYIFLAGMLLGMATILREAGKIKANIKSGADFNGNNRVSDDGWDLGHVERDY